MRTTEILMIGLLGAMLAACGDYSNSRLAEDLEFLTAIPDKSTLELRVAESEPRDLEESESPLQVRTDALGDVAVYFLSAFEMATDINSGVFGFLEIVDLVTREIPPTLREKGRRVWGPWPSEDDPGVDIRFEMQKIEPGLFVLRFQFRRDEQADTFGFDEGWVSCVHGPIRPRGDVRRGQGTLTIDLDACARVTDSGEAGIAVVQYDTTTDADNPTGKTRLDIEFTAFLAKDENGEIGPDAQPLDALYSYAEHSDLSGAFDFEIWGDINENDPDLDAVEHLELKVRWKPDRTGRADIRVSEGDLGAFEMLIQECWDSDHKRVYYTDNFNPDPTEGDPADCSLPPTPFGE